MDGIGIGFGGVWSWGRDGIGFGFGWGLYGVQDWGTIEGGQLWWYCQLVAKPWLALPL